MRMNHITAALAAAEECANKARGDSAEHLRNTACPIRHVRHRDHERPSLTMGKGREQTDSGSHLLGSGKLLSASFKSKRQWWG